MFLILGQHRAPAPQDSGAGLRPVPSHTRRVRPHNVLCQCACVQLHAWHTMHGVLHYVLAFVCTPETAQACKAKGVQQTSNLAECSVACTCAHCRARTHARTRARAHTRTHHPAAAIPPAERPRLTTAAAPVRTERQPLERRRVVKRTASKVGPRTRTRTRTHLPGRWRTGRLVYWC